MIVYGVILKREISFLGFFLLYLDIKVGIILRIMKIFIHSSLALNNHHNLLKFFISHYYNLKILTTILFYNKIFSIFFKNHVNR
jgi:hypothetical protein